MPWLIVDGDFRSINSGFAALRAALPMSTPTDSKAVVLRKAVAHVNHLETLLNHAGIGYSAPASRDEWEAEDATMEGDDRVGDDVHRVKQERWDDQPVERVGWRRGTGDPLR